MGSTPFRRQRGVLAGRNEGWFPHGEEKALYDQQPIEAATMAEPRWLRSICLATKNTWLHSAARADGSTAKTA